MKRPIIHRIYLIFGIGIFAALLFNTCKTSDYAETADQLIVATVNHGDAFKFELQFEKGPAHNYPLMAVWIEDIEGNFIQTLYVAMSVAKGKFAHATARDGQWVSGPLRRPATLPYWAHRQNTVAGNEDPFPSPKNPIADAYTGATPNGDFTLRSSLEKIIDNPFRVWFEINQFFDFNNFWTNSRYPDDRDYRTSGQPALIYASDLIFPDKLPVTVPLHLVGHSHYSGMNGHIYSSLHTLTTAKDIVKSIKVTVSPQ
jgi:hypothetical protein